MKIVELTKDLFDKFENDQVSAKVFFLAFRMIQEVMVKESVEEFGDLTEKDVYQGLVKEFQNIQGFETLERINEGSLQKDPHLSKKEEFLVEVEQFLEVMPNIV